MIPFLFAEGEIIPTNYIIWAICIGTNLGYLYMCFSRNVIGGVVRRLLQSSLGEENAKTLSELGYAKFSLLHKILLKDGGMLRCCVSVIGGKIPKITNSNGEEALSFESAKFYISSEGKSRAEKSYGTPQKWIFLPIFIVLSVGVSYLMTLVMPMLLDALPI